MLRMPATYKMTTPPIPPHTFLRMSTNRGKNSPDVIPNQFIFSSINPKPLSATFTIPCVSLNINFHTSVMATAPVTAGKYRMTRKTAPPLNHFCVMRAENSKPIIKLSGMLSIMIKVLTIALPNPTITYSPRKRLTNTCRLIGDTVPASGI